MPSFSLRRFSEPDTLKAIDPSILIRFLRPFDEYLRRRDFSLPATPSSDIDYGRLCRILITSDDTVRPEMVDALYYVHELSDEEGMEGHSSSRLTRRVSRLPIRHEPLRSQERFDDFPILVPRVRHDVGRTKGDFSRVGLAIKCDFQNGGRIRAVRRKLLPQLYQRREQIGSLSGPHIGDQSSSQVS